jgi:DedD protein
MDRRVKERLIGATILVLLIVLVVPELLSGPKRSQPAQVPLRLPTPTRNVSVDLATSKATTASGVPDSAAASGGSGAEPDGDDAQGGPTPATPGAAAPDAAVPAHADQPPATAPTVTTLRAQQAPAPALETRASTPRSTSEASRAGVAADGDQTPASPSHHGWAVQLGSFANKANAEKLAHQLRAQRSPVYVISSGSGPSLRYRVRIGPLRDRDAAEHAIAKLKAEGHAATIVAP